MTAETPHGALSGFMVKDRLARVVWTAAFALAVVVHSAAFLVASSQPAKPTPVTMTMAIAIPPPPPPPLKDDRKQPPKPEPVNAAPPPAPPAPPSETPPPVEQPTPQASEQVTALAPTTGQGVAVAVGTPDGVAGAPPPTSTGPASDVPTTNRAQSGPALVNWNESGYKSGAFESMSKNKRYPRKAEVLGLEGRCMVVIRLNHDGSLAEKPKVFGKGSGHELLDEECVAMAERTTFAPIPAHIAAPVTFRIPVEFHLVNR